MLVAAEPPEVVKLSDLPSRKWGCLAKRSDVLQQVQLTAATSAHSFVTLASGCHITASKVPSISPSLLP